MEAYASEQYELFGWYRLAYIEQQTETEDIAELEALKWQYSQPENINTTWKVYYEQRSK